MSGNTPTVDALHALVVEDEDIVRDLMSEFLSAIGVKNISLAANGREGLEILRDDSKRIDVVFCDLHMPEMDGIEMIRRAASLDRRPALVIVSVAHEALLSTVSDMARSRGMHVLEWVVKPITRERMEDILTEYCGVLANTAVEKSQGFLFAPNENDFTTALDRGEFLLHYQPIVSAVTGEAEAVEALIRWNHNVHGLLWPSAFVPDAAGCGAIGAITDRAIDLAIRQCADWNAQDHRTRISVNLDSSTLRDRNSPQRIAALGKSAGIGADQIILEITESIVAGDGAEDALAVLRELRDAGFSIAIDDFGTSYSELSGISSLPFDVMKIDRALTMNCVGDETARSIVASGVALAHNLGMKVVAEGVESDDEIKLVKQLGVDSLQGFILARPMPAESVPDWVANRPAAK
ncbi:MAG: EAL domain-containing response regulator [Rhodobacteraceae bacterium]|nr:EAL domain-containing response regulator [Paracoccaceae bacterium]